MKLRIVYFSLILAIISILFISFNTQSAKAYNFEGMQVTLKCIDWDDKSDTTYVHLDSLSLFYDGTQARAFVYCNVFPDYFKVIYLSTGIGGCTGVGTWEVTPENSILRWADNTSCGAEGTITIAELDTTSNYLRGSFDFEVATYSKKQFWQVICEFSSGDAGLSISIDEGTYFNLGKGDSTEINLQVSGPDENPMDSAYVSVRNPFSGSDEFFELGMVNPSGQFTYKIKVPDSTSDGEYTFEFYAERDGFASSNILECTVNVSKLLYMDVEPEDDITIGFQDTVDFDIYLYDDMSQAVKETEIYVADPIQSDGTPTLIGSSDDDGMLTYRLITNEETLGGEYIIKFSAFNEEFSDTATKEIPITISAKLVLSVSPDSTIIAMPKDTILYSISVKDLSNVLSEGADIYATDSIISNGAWSKIGTTNDEGKINYQIIIPEDAKQGIYNVQFYAVKDGFENSDTINAVIDLKVKSDCVDLGVFTICTNASNGWVSADSTNPNNNKIKQEGIVTINNFLYFLGTMTLDTTLLELTATGEFYIDKIPLPGGSQGKYVLNKGTYSLKLLGADGVITNFYNSAYEELGQIFGVTFKITNLELVGGRRAEGMKMSCKLIIPGIAGDCGEPDKTNTEIDFNGLSVTDSLGFTVDGMKIKDLGLYYPKFCLKELGFNYNRTQDRLAIGSEIAFPFGTVGGGFALVKGLIDSIGWKVDGGWPPKFVLGTSTVGISGFFGHISNITSPELEMALGGIFIDLTSEYLYSIDVSGKYKMPSFFEVAGQGSFFKPPAGIEHWQLKADISASYDFSTWLMELKGAVKIATQDGVKYLITGDGSFKMDNKKSTPKFAGKFTGNIELPKFKDVYPYKWLNSMFDFPIKGSVWTRFVYGKSKVLYGDAQFSSASYGPYKLDFVIDLSKQYGDEDYFWFKAEKGSGGNHMIKNYNGDPTNGIALNHKSKIDIMLEGEVRDTLQIPEYMDLIVLNLKSETQAPASMLIDPDGNEYTETSDDKTIALSISEDGMESFWTLLNPTPGDWIIEISNPSETDSLDIFINETKPSQQIQVNQDGQYVNVAWDSDIVAEGDSVYILLDNDMDGYDGFSVAVEDAQLGEVTFMLNDSMDACSYYVLALFEGEEYAAVYNEETIINPKATLLPPDNIIAEYDTSSHILTITWNPSDEEDLVGYSIKLIDTEGLDSLIADVYNNISEISFEIDDVEGKQIQFVAYNDASHSGCPSEAIDIEIIIVGIEDNPFISNSSLSVYPNPANELIKISYNTIENGNVSISITDVLGNEVYSFDEGYKPIGNHNTTKSISNLSNGTYFLTIKHSSFTQTIRLAIIK